MSALDDLAVRVGDQLIVFPGAGKQGPICVAQTEAGRRCRLSIQCEGYGGWSAVHVPEFDGEVNALEPLDEACFIHQRCPDHLATEVDAVLAPTWVPFAPSQHAHLVVQRPKMTWTAEGIQTARPRPPGPAMTKSDDEFALLLAAAYAERSEPLHTTALYRYYDQQDRLLYVGITDALMERISSHIKSSSWMDFASRSTIDRHPTRKAAETAEREAIKAERPLFNSMHNDTPEGRRRLVEYLVEHGRTDLLVPDVSRG
ncbi:hypothetical protein [Nonomuraea indica]|uniref:hypothetical protein n=1 Tax=Nonomuraea indica TaxID=1581193 RepID=UPI000C7C3CA4|nr:hypothetical protein [Nonomuraea indica]